MLLASFVSVCLFAVWWHLLAAPIWFLCMVELLILVVYAAAAIGLIDPKPWSERSHQQGATALEQVIVHSVPPLRGFNSFPNPHPVG
jgi:hypothetical protein